MTPPDKFDRQGNPASAKPTVLFSKHRKYTCALVALVLTVVATASPLRAAVGLGEQIGGVIQAAEFKHAHWGIFAVDLANGETVYEMNADHLFAPASTTKLFSTAAALEGLGADYRFETPIYRRGDVDAAGELKGDLILVASGDLSL